MLAKKSLAGESCFLLIHIIQHYKKLYFRLNQLKK